MSRTRRPLLARIEEAIEFDTNGGCWLWSRSGVKGGYGKMKVQGSNVLVHRLSWQIVNGPIPRGKIACHKCDVPQCVNPSHIFIGTHKENTEDMLRKGRSAAVFTQEQADSIRRERAAGVTRRALQERYGVSKSAVVNALIGKIPSYAFSPATSVEESDHKKPSGMERNAGQ